MRAHLYTLAGVCALPGALCAYRHKVGGAYRPPNPQAHQKNLVKPKDGLTRFFWFQVGPAKLEVLPIAIYHLNIKIISRGAGRSAVAAAAYRAAERITNEYDGEIHDYTRKGGVVHTEILLPDHAPAEYADRAILWNAVEKIEKAKNSQLAREIDIALPVELTKEQNISLVREYVNRHFVSVGMCADIAVHDKGDGNPHAHVMLTMRPIEQNGEWGAKARKVNGRPVPTTDWNEQTKAEVWRAAWADAVNAALERYNHAQRVDHRSYARQGVEQLPTVHLGVAAAQMERRGIATERGNLNREIRRMNLQLQRLHTQLRGLKLWLKNEVQKPSPSPLADVVECILQREERAGRGRETSTKKSAASALEFLREHEVQDFEDLIEVVRDVYREFDNVQSQLRYFENRAPKLKEHIRQAEYLKEFRPFYKAYKALKPRKQPKFYEAHRREIMLYEYTRRYFKEHRITREQIVPKKWREEIQRLPTERVPVYKQYDLVKEKVEKVERVRRCVDDALRRERARTRPRTRSRDRGVGR